MTIIGEMAMIRIPKYSGQANRMIAFLLLCSLCLGQYFGITPVNLGFTALLVGLACLVPLNDLFVIMYATLPLYNIINYRVGTYTMHYLIVGLFILKFLYYQKVPVQKLLIFLALFIIRIFAADFVLLVSWSLLIMPLILTLDSKIWGDNIKDVVFWMNTGMLLSCLVGYIMMVTQKTIYTTAYLYISGERTVRFAGLTGDSVSFGQTCALVIGINLVFCFYSKERKKFYVLSSIILALAALLSISKMTLTCLVLVCMTFLVMWAKTHAVTKKQVLCIVLITGVGLILLANCTLFLMNYRGSSSLILGYIDRFTRDDLSTGRFSIWGVYLEILLSKLRYLFVPLTSEMLSAPIWNPSTSSYVGFVHNLYLETIAVFGWCAAILIFVWLIRRLYTHFSRGRSLMLAIPVFVVLFMGIGSHGNFEYQFYLQFALALSFLNPEVGRALKGSDSANTGSR